MEFHDVWNRMETSLRTIDGPEMYDDDFEMRLERFKSGYRNSRNVDRASYENCPESVARYEATMRNDIYGKRDDETLGDSGTPLQEVIKRQMRYRNGIEKIWKDFERHYVDEILEPVMPVPAVGGDCQIRRTENGSNVWEEMRLRLIRYKIKIENLWNELSAIVIFGPKEYFTKIDLQ